MPATSLDPHTALVIIDLQKGLAAYPTLEPLGQIVARTAELVEAFRKKSLPIAFVHVGSLGGGVDWANTRTETRRAVPPSMAEFTDFMPELILREGDIVITKRNWSAFYGTELELQLRRRGVTGIVLTGVSTSIGVDSTARAAHERSYNVTFASDAITDMDADAHRHSMTKIFPRIGEIDTTAAILALLA